VITKAGGVDFVMRQAELWAKRGEEAHETRPRGPVREFHLELTHRCNLKCVMCHHWEMPSTDPASVGREMTLEEIKTLVSKAKALNEVETVVVTGGEPLLRPDIAAVLGVLAERFPKASIGVLTNFANTAMVRAAITAARARGVSRLWLGSSLDGLEQTHDRVRGRRGAFRGLIKTAEMMRAEFPDVDFSFSFTITPDNYAQLLPAYRLVSEMGVWFGAQMVVNHEGLFAPGGAVFSWTEEQLSDIEDAIFEIIKDIALREKAMSLIFEGRQKDGKALWSRLLYWKYLRDYVRSPKRFFKNCLAGERYAMFDPEGNLFFCPVNKHRTVGNARDGGFDALWFSEKARSERSFVASGQCDCWLNCIANPILDRLIEGGAA